MSPANAVVWQKNPALAWREIEDDTVIISPDDSMMHELNDTGSFLWKNIDGKKSVAQLAELLFENYAVTLATALADTQVLLDEMSSRKLLVPVPEAGGAPR